MKAQINTDNCLKNLGRWGSFVFLTCILVEGWGQNTDRTKLMSKLVGRKWKYLGNYVENLDNKLWGGVKEKA